MEEFRDRFDRIILIDVDDSDARAFYEGQEVGLVQTTGILDADDPRLAAPAEITWMGVDPSFQRAGIGLELIKRLAEHLDRLNPARRDRGIGGENAMTPEGYALTVKAQTSGYVRPFSENRW